MLVFKSRTEKGCISILVSKLYERKFVVKIFVSFISPSSIKSSRPKELIVEPNRFAYV